MSYYRPSYSQTVAMSRGRGFSSSRASSYRGGNGSSRGGSSWGGRSQYSSSSSAPSRYSSFSNSFEPRSPKYPMSTDRYGGNSMSSRPHADEFRKPYRSESSGYSGRDHRSPDRKRMRPDNNSTRHESSFGGQDSYGRFDTSGYPERRSFSNDRRPPIRTREEFRKPAPLRGGGGYRGRLSTRGAGSLRIKMRYRPIRSTPTTKMSYTMRRRVRDQLKARLRSAAFRRGLKRTPITDDKEESDKELDESKEESKKAEEEEVDETKDEAEAEDSTTKSPKKDGEKEEKKESDGEEHAKKRFVKLVCPQCGLKCATFRKYSLHLRSVRHRAAMRRMMVKQKNILHQMRTAQRNAQKELEKNAEDLAPRTNFCPLCKLNYKQTKATHQASDAHKNMKKFLMPYCKVCRSTLSSPMAYEDHLCSIEHLKRKSVLLNGDKSDEGSGDDNLENFMTIDSVGDMEDDEATGEKKEGEKKETKEPINVGVESIRKVEVHYCDLCHMYLPRAEEEEMPRILAKHCKQRTHLTRYIRCKEDKELTKRAERLQRKETAEKEKEKKEDGDGKDEEKKDIKNEEEDQGEDKLWADVDKDLGDILAEAESGNKSSDEDENGERYDRFKLSEKNGDDKIDPAEEAEKEKTEKDEQK